MLAEHEGHLARDREVRGLVERVRDHWRRWPELGWAASAQGLPIEELAEHNTWREEGAALLEAGRSLVVAEGEAARRVVVHHLHAMPGVRAGLEEAVEMLERTRLLDDAERFERAWHALREGAVEIGVPELHAPGHRQVAEAGERLEAAEGIDAGARLVVAEWRKIEAAQVALAEEVRTLPGRIAAWRERRADLAQDEPGGLDPKHPARRAWREEGGALEAVAGDMLHPKSVHAPHLDAVEGQRAGIRQAAQEVREALVEATSSLESTLLAVKAREKNVLSAVVRRSADELRRDWKAHLAEAGAVRVDPFYVPGHEELIDRLQKLRAGPAVEELPERERNQIDSILGEDRRQTKAVSHVHNYLDKVERFRNDFKELRDLAHTSKSKLEEVPSYDEWHDTAERLLAAGKAIVDDHKTYGPCLDHTFHAWMDVHASIRELESALGRDTSSLRHQQPELYLQPITRPVPTLDEAKEADASYRRLRDQWHTHLALAETSELHPYEIQGYATLIDAMREIRDRPHLDATARNALDAVLDQHLRIEQARADIDRYLKDTARAFRSLENLKDVAERFSTHGVQLEKIGSYKEWKQRALELAASGKAMLADRQHYGIHLNENPDLAHRIHADVQRLNAAIGRDDTSISRERGQSPSEDEKTAERPSQRRSIKP